MILGFFDIWEIDLRGFIWLIIYTWSLSYNSSSLPVRPGENKFFVYVFGFGFGIFLFSNICMLIKSDYLSSS